MKNNLVAVAIGFFIAGVLVGVLLSNAISGESQETAILEAPLLLGPDCEYEGPPSFGDCRTNLLQCTTCELIDPCGSRVGYYRFCHGTTTPADL